MLRRLLLGLALAASVFLQPSVHVDASHVQLELAAPAQATTATIIAKSGDTTLAIPSNYGTLVEIDCLGNGGRGADATIATNPGAAGGSAEFRHLTSAPNIVANDTLTVQIGTGASPADTKILDHDGSTVLLLCKAGGAASGTTGGTAGSGGTGGSGTNGVTAGNATAASVRGGLAGPGAPGPTGVGKAGGGNGASNSGGGGGGSDAGSSSAGSSASTGNGGAGGNGTSGAGGAAQTTGNNVPGNGTVGGGGAGANTGSGGKAGDGGNEATYTATTGSYSGQSVGPGGGGGGGGASATTASRNGGVGGFGAGGGGAGETAALAGTGANGGDGWIVLIFNVSSADHNQLPMTGVGMLIERHSIPFAANDNEFKMAANQ
jgi:hypothetical protein